MKIAKNVLVVIMLMLILGGSVACNKTESSPEVEAITLPKLINLEAGEAKQILINNLLIPEVVFEENDEVKEGLVFAQEPEAGTSVEKNGSVKLFISEGIGSNVIVPDVKGIKLDDGKNILIGASLIPDVYEEFSGTVREGLIIRQEPAGGKKIDQQAKVKLYVSLGSEIVSVKDATINWLYIGTQKDDWEFYSPVIDRRNKTITIELTAILGTAVEMHDPYDSGSAVTTVVINDPFKKKVPGKFEYSGEKFIKKGEERTFTLIIPLSEVTSDFPTDYVASVGCHINGDQSKYHEITLSFTSTW